MRWNKLKYNRVVPFALSEEIDFNKQLGDLVDAVVELVAYLNDVIEKANSIENQINTIQNVTDALDGLTEDVNNLSTDYSKLKTDYEDLNRNLGSATTDYVQLSSTTSALYDQYSDLLDRVDAIDPPTE